MYELFLNLQIKIKKIFKTDSCMHGGLHCDSRAETLCFSEMAGFGERSCKNIVLRLKEGVPSRYICPPIDIMVEANLL